MAYKSVAVSKNIRQELENKCQENGWLRENGYDFIDGFLTEGDYPFGFVGIETTDDLQEFFEYGSWAIRQGVVYKDLAFINQVDGGDEWWTLKKFEGEWLAIESITWRRIIKDGEFLGYLERLMVASKEQCKTLTY